MGQSVGSWVLQFMGSAVHGFRSSYTPRLRPLTSKNAIAHCGTPQPTSLISPLPLRPIVPMPTIWPLDGTVALFMKKNWISLFWGSCASVEHMTENKLADWLFRGANQRPETICLWLGLG